MEIADTLRGRQCEVAERLESLGDYLWKLPEFLEQQAAKEREKLWMYFPGSEDPEENAFHSRLRVARANHEFGRIFDEFPTFMGQSSLIQVVSIFEFYLLQICYDFQDAGGVDLNEFRGRDRGVRKLFSYLAMARPSRGKPLYADPIYNAILFRNCLAHAGGLLQMSRDDKHIRSIISGKLYIPKASSVTSATANLTTIHVL